MNVNWKLTASHSKPSQGASDGVGCLRTQERVLALREAVRASEDGFKQLRPVYSTFERICRCFLYDHRVIRSALAGIKRGTGIGGAS